VKTLTKINPKDTAMAAVATAYAYWKNREVIQVAEWIEPEWATIVCVKAPNGHKKRHNQEMR